MKTKKPILIAVAAVAVVAVMWLISHGVFIGLFAYTSRWEFAAEYEEYASEFNIVKDYVLENYASEERRTLSITSPLSEHGRTLYEYETKEYATLPEEVKAALDTIDEEAFRQDASIECIHVHGNRVDFWTIKGYRLVYSPDGKPTWFREPDDETPFRVKRIKDGWYHVVAK